MSLDDDKTTREGVRRLIELLGGAEKAREILNQGYEEELALWEQHTDSIGRVLRAHLYLEYRMTRYLEARNPKLGDIEKARLSFSQKLTLLNENDEHVSHLIAGTRQINLIRNRMGHRINVKIEIPDCEVLLSNSLFSNFRKALAKPSDPSNDVVDIIEEFAKFAGSWFKNSVDPLRHIWAEAFRSEGGEELIG